MGQWLAVLLWAAGGCAPEEQSPPLRVVAVYDLSAVASLSGAKDVAFSWHPESNVSSSCGPERAPAGLERPEAESMATGRMPVLAVLLEHVGELPQPGAPASLLRTDQLRVYLQDDGASFSDRREASDVNTGSVTAGNGTGGRGDPPATDERYADPPATDERYAEESGEQLRRSILQPAVLPLRLKVHPRVAAVEPLLGQTIFFQLTVQLCAEHKLGRAWIGSAREQELDEAFLRTDETQPEQAFFRGQGQPVPALLGPMLWSVEPPGDEVPRWLREVWGDWSTDASGGNRLIEADIWGARAPRPAGPSSVAAGRILPLRSGAGAICAPSRLAGRLRDRAAACLTARTVPEQELLLALSGDGGGSETRMRVTLTTAEPGRNDKGSPSSPLSGTPSVLVDDRITRDDRAQDIVSRIPRYLPQLTSRDEHPSVLLTSEIVAARDDLCGSSTRSAGARGPSDREEGESACRGRRGGGSASPANFAGAARAVYSVLLIPNWQLAGALRSLQRERMPAGDGITDGVGYVLQRTDLLHIQYVPGRAAVEAVDLMSPFRGSGSWVPGYWPGLWAASAPILLPETSEPVTPAQHAAVFLREWVAVQGCALLLLVLATVCGFARLGELWQRPPVERAAYWPGVKGLRSVEDARQSRETGNRESDRPS